MTVYLIGFVTESVTEAVSHQGDGQMGDVDSDPVAVRSFCAAAIGGPAAAERVEE